MHILRWILMPVVCFAAWFAALFVGIIAHSVAESFCPQDQMVSGMCYGPWLRRSTLGLFASSPLLPPHSLFLLRISSAPASRHLVAWSVFAAGAVAALWI